MPDDLGASVIDDLAVARRAEPVPSISDQGPGADRVRTGEPAPDAIVDHGGSWASTCAVAGLVIVSMVLGLFLA